MAAGVGTDENGMGISVADYNGDAKLDIFISSIFQPTCDVIPSPCIWGYTGNRLYRNEGSRVFSDQTDAAGVRDGAWGWGARFFDFDNDGDLDLTHTNGMNLDGTELEDPFNNDQTRLWRNDGGVFTDVSTEAGITDTDSGKGLLTFDYDADGDLDLLITNHGAPPVLYRNDTENNNDWLRVKTEGRVSNRDGVGAWITVQIVDGGPQQVWEVHAGSDYLGQSEITAHFGLGEGTDPVALVTVEWPSGLVQRFTDVARNDTLLAQEPEVDMNGDGQVNALDIDELRTAMNSSATDPVYDVNGDSNLNQADLDYLVQVLLGTVPGDCNLDRIVDANDLADVRRNFGVSPAGWALGNFDLNLLVDANDLADVRRNFRFSVPSQAVPETATLTLLILAASGLVRRSWVLEM